MVKSQYPKTNNEGTTDCYTVPLKIVCCLNTISLFTFEVLQLICYINFSTINCNDNFLNRYFDPAIRRWLLPKTYVEAKKKNS